MLKLWGVIFIHASRELSGVGVRVLCYVFNNDRYRDCYGVVPYVKEPEICYESRPHVVVALMPESVSAGSLKGLSGRGFSVELLGDGGEELFEASGRLTYSSSPLTPEVLASVIELPSKLPNARRARVRIGSLVEEVELPEQVRVYGRVTDFKGRPRKAYIRLVSPDGVPGGVADARTDDGCFEMLAPAATYHHAFICDGGYARSTLEFYGWFLPVKPPEFRLDARFDKIEVYRLTAAETPERTLLIHFVAWDIAYTSEILKNDIQG